MFEMSVGGVFDGRNVIWEDSDIYTMIDQYTYLLASSSCWQ